MDQTPNLLLPYILAAQAQKHVTHNDAIRRLDAIVQLAVADRNLSAPPGSPVEGQRYIVASSPTGAWAGHTNEIAAYQDGAWALYAPLEGWLAWIADEDVLVNWTGSAWALASGGSLNPAPLVGVNATADATNKLSVASDAVLFNHNGTSTQVKLNKAALANSASFLFQDAFSGRAEIGLTGDDDFHFKVSPDGTTFVEALILNKTTGATTHKAGARSTFTHDATNAGLNLVPVAGDPSTLSNGDVWYNATLAKFRKRENGTTSDLSSGGAGEINTASNVGTAGVGVFKQKTGVNLEFKKINAGNAAVTITDDTANSEVDIAIAGNGVTNALLAQMPANTIKGNNTGATANAADLTAAQAKAVLAITSADVSGLAAIAASGSAADLSSGLLPAARFDDTAHGARAGGTLHAAATTSVSGFLSAADKTKLDGVATGANAYGHPNHTGDVTSVADGATTIAANAVTNTKAADMPANTLKGNNTGATADPADLNGGQATALLDPFIASGAGSKKGLVPDPGSTAGATKFLREDAVWAVPAGGGGGPATGADGSATIDFGAGSDIASLAITGQASISALSVTHAWIFPKDTADHSADEHIVEELDVYAGAATAGTGFTIFARTRNKPQRGQWTVAWSWR